jgi:hypothetical protein
LQWSPFLPLSCCAPSFTLLLCSSVIYIEPTGSYWPMAGPLNHQFWQQEPGHFILWAWQPQCSPWTLRLNYIQYDKGRAELKQKQATSFMRPKEMAWFCCPSPANRSKLLTSDDHSLLTPQCRKEQDHSW